MHIDTTSLALTQLQADAFVCMDPVLSRAVSGIVTVASIDDLGIIV